MAEVPHLFRSGIDVAHRKIIHPYLTRGEAKDDREIAHERALSILEKMQSNKAILKLFNKLFSYNDPILKTQLAGIDLPNPLGIAAGFDKNARIYKMLGKGLGFGVVTIGSVTKIQYNGNERPRIFDLPENNGVINRMGFPGDGVMPVTERLFKDRKHSRNYGLVVNLAASKPSFENDSAISDYTYAAKVLMPFGDIDEVNVSSPNTPGVRGLQEPEIFADLSKELRYIYTQSTKPVFYKFGPDLPIDKLKKDVEIALSNGASGITLTNTTTDTNIRQNLRPDKYKDEAGGISGTPLTKKSLEISHAIYEFTNGSIPIKRAGGVKNGQDLWDALTYGGATVVDVYTAFVRPTTSTPNFAYYMLKDLATAMKKTGITSMEDFKSLRGKKVPYPSTGAKR